MPVNPKKICWETSCLIATHNEEPERVGVCKAIIEAARKGEVILYTSFLTMCEWLKPADKMSLAILYY